MVVEVTVAIDCVRSAICSVLAKSCFIGGIVVLEVVEVVGGSILGALLVAKFLGELFVAEFLGELLVDFSLVALCGGGGCCKAGGGEFLLVL